VHKAITRSLLTSLVLLSTNVLADWKLENSASNLNFVSIKKSSIAEVHHFKQLNGKITENGFAKVMIDLASVETNIPIRNERMKAKLFETNQFTSASIESKFKPQLVKQLSVGDSVIENLEFKLSLHGNTDTFTASVRISKTKEGLLVSNMQPIIINASQYDLVKGIEALRNLASLPSIATAVPVNFNLMFKTK
jgi:polyisoprenoid-binding protein YceI